jgi:hypothetical protein
VKPFSWVKQMNKYQEALRKARKIPLGKKTPEKCKAVHEWVLAVKQMLKGE